MRAYNEINEFEKELHDWGAVIIKFWVQIDKDTQLARFTDRQNTIAGGADRAAPAVLPRWKLSGFRSAAAAWKAVGSPAAISHSG